NVGGRLEEIVERAGRRLGVMIERGQSAVTIGAETQGLPRRRTMPYRTEHLLAAQHELDRPARDARSDDAENLRSRDEAFAAEAAAQEWAADVNRRRRQVEHCGQTRLRPSEALARRIDRERIAFPCCDDRMGLHGIVILR